MSWFTPSTILPDSWKKELKAMVNNCDAADSTVADYINSIADGASDDDHLKGEALEPYLKGCLQELAKSAMGLLAKLEGNLPTETEALIKNNQGKDVVFEVDDKPSLAIMSFDYSEAKGTVAMERGPYGVWFWVDGKVIGGIDLFHQAIIDEGEEPYPQIVISDNIGDAVAHIRFKKDKIEFLPEDNAKPQWEYDEPKESETVQAPFVEQRRSAP